MPLIKHIGRKKTKVRFDIYFRDIKFSKNEYFVSNSKYSLTLDGYKNGEIFSKNETYTYEDLSKVRIKDSMEFIATLYQNQKERDTNTYQKKEKTLVLRQYSKQLGRKEGVIYRDLIEVALPLDALLTKNSDEEIKLKFHDESVKGHINAVVKFKVLDNSSNNAKQKEQGALPEPTDTSSIIQYKDVNVRQPKEESKNSGGVVPKITGANRQAVRKPIRTVTSQTISNFLVNVYSSTVRSVFS